MLCSSGSERGAFWPPNKKNPHLGKLNGGNLVTGLVVGAGTLLLWPLIGPALRPIPKTAIECGLIAYREAEPLSRVVGPSAGPRQRSARGQAGSGSLAPYAVRPRARLPISA